MKKVLLIARIAKFFVDFELSNIRILQELGCEVWCAGNYDDGDASKLDSYGVKKVHLEFHRSPLDLTNIKECKKLVKLMKNEHFDIVHCHMPIGGVYGRISALFAGIENVIYTAHGFQFLQGGPKKDWLLYYPVEKIMSNFTDTLITINDEDYELSVNKFKARNNIHLHGVGVNVKEFNFASSIREELCKKYQMKYDSFIILSVGELRKLKNHETIIRAISLMDVEERKDIQYLICGVGALEEYLKNLIGELGLERQVHLLGWRDDVKEICKSADIFAFPSTREGLPLSVMEAMAAGLPVIASDVRGSKELLDNGLGGIVCKKNIPEEYASGIKKMMEMKKKSQLIDMSIYNLNKIKNYDIDNIAAQMKKIYEEQLGRCNGR